MNISEQKPSILLVIDGLEFGGGERVFLQLAAGLNDRLEVFVAATPGGKFEDGIKERGINFLAVNMGSRFSLNPIRKISAIIKSGKIGLVHSQGARADYFARIAGIMAGVSYTICTIAMPIEGFDVRPLRKLVYRAVDSITEKFVDKFIVVSDPLEKNLIERRGIPAYKVVKIYNGIELDKYYPDNEDKKIRQELEIAKDVPLIGAIGRMVWQKGLEFLIRAIPIVMHVMPEAKFLLVGEGPFKKSLEDLAVSLKVKEHVIFTGYRSDVKEILSAIDLFIVPSILEGFPMVTLEAMAMMKPIIASNIDGINEQIIDGKCGILVPAKDHRVLAEAMVQLVQDRDFAKKLGIEARNRVEREFSVEKMVRSTERVYQDLMKEKNRSAEKRNAK